MYRKDVLERIDYMFRKGDTKPNFAKLAREMGCDYRTVKKAYESAQDPDSPPDPPSRKAKPRKIDPHLATIKAKVEAGCTYVSVFKFIRDREGYDGCLTSVKYECERIAGERLLQATMRFETAPGVQAQIDWKESMTLRKRDGTTVTFNVFLMVLGWSRARFIELTMDRTQPTLMRCICDGIGFFGGVPSEVLFDNMRTVADRAKGEYGRGKVNAVFDAFAADCLFEPVLCKAFHPYTKGKAEDLAKLMERLRPYDGEFEREDELRDIVSGLLADINSEPSQATGLPPERLLAEERKYLRMPDLAKVLREHAFRPIRRKVSRESLVTFEGRRYSVKPRYVGKTVEVEAKGGELLIYYSNELVSRHRIDGKRFSFHEDDYVEIMKSKSYKGVPDDEVLRIARSNLAIYDSLR